MPLRKLAPEDLQRQFNVVAAGGHARTAVLLRAILRSSFNRAVHLRRMSGNPVLGTDPVTYMPEETATFTMEEGLRFLEAAENDRLGAMFTIMLSRPAILPSGVIFTLASPISLLMRKLAMLISLAPASCQPGGSL